MRRFLKNYLYLFMPVLFAFSLLGGGSGTLALQQKLASNSDKSFGDSIDSDNGTLIVGSIGGAHIFRYNSVSGIWERTAHLPVGAPFSSVTVGIDANRAVVALPDERTVHIFERSDGASDVWKKVKSISRPYSVDFGGAVSLVGDTVFVGAFRENMSRGALYIFEKNEGGESVWGEKKKISFSSSFGFGLSVVSDGDRVFVGTDGDMAVYLFEKNSGGKGAWGLVKKIEMPFSASFAASLAVDGDTIVVGAPYDESQKGAFYIFEKDQGGLDNWGEVQRFEGETEYGRIAKYVALKDGVIAVSSRSFSNYKNPVFIFTRRGDDTNLWKKTATILYDDKDSIVSSLTIDNGSVMAGMPWHSSYNGAVALFEKGSEEGSLYEERYKIILHPELDPYFADKVAISGNRAVVTSPDYNSNGSLSVFNRKSKDDIWEMHARLIPGEDIFYFANVVAIDGETIVVSATDRYGNSAQHGKVYIFEKDSGGLNNWGLATTLSQPGDSYFGLSLAIKDDVLVVGSGGYHAPGAVYIFEKQGGAWIEKQTLFGDSGYSDFGKYMVFDGVVIVAVAPNFDGIYFFEKGSGDVWELVKKMETGGFSSLHMALHGDTLALGRSNGALQLFGRNEGGLNNWGLVQSGLIPVPPNRDVAIAFDETKLVATVGGDLYLFTNDSGDADGWELTQKLEHPPYVYFSKSVAIEGDTVVVGTDGTNYHNPLYFFSFQYCPQNSEPTDIQLSSLSVDENSSLFSTVGRLSTVDVDSDDSYTYSVIVPRYYWDNRIDNFFVVDGDELKTSALFDAEIVNSYDVIIRTEDSCGGIFEKEFTITITNIDEVPDYETPEEDIWTDGDVIDDSDTADDDTIIEDDDDEIDENEDEIDEEEVDSDMSDENSDTLSSSACSMIFLSHAL